MKVKIKQGSIRLQKKFKTLHKVDGQWVQVGHFASQGEHYSGYSFAQLAAMYHMGMVAGQPARKVLDALFFYNLGLDDNISKRIKNFWIKNLNTKDMLEMIGMNLARKEKDIFGVVNPFMPPDSDGTPLLEEGDLRDSVAYKTSMDRVVREIN